MRKWQVTERWSGESAYWPADPLSGAEILQLTGNVAMATNIYCEDPACSPDNRIAVARSLYCNAQAPGELWVTDLERGTSVLADSGVSWVGACPQAYGDLYFYPAQTEQGWEMRRLCFSTLEVEVVHRFTADKPAYRTLGSASPDGRHLVSMRRREDGRYEVLVLDLTNGSEQTIALDEDFFNPHPRFDRQQGEWVLVQHNRGQRLQPNGSGARVIDAEIGVTLELCKYDGSEQHTLPIARPFIPQSISGHESWLKDEPAFIYSTTPLDPPYTDGQRTGNLLHYRLGDERPTVIADAPDLYFGHVSSSACGRYWCCDAWNWPHDGQDCCRVAPRIFVGSIATGRFAAVCDVGGVWPRYENGHAHPYLSADNRYVIFTSTRTGFPQVFRATLPADFLAALDG